MNIQIFGTKKCNDTKKAERFFKERGIKYQFIDMKEKGMSKGEFTSVAQTNGGIDNMLNQSCKDQDTLSLIRTGEKMRSVRIILIVFTVLLLAGCKNREEQIMDGDGMFQKIEYTQITQEEARRMMSLDDGHVIVDVRRADEFAEGHIPGAILIPNESIEDSPPEELPDQDQIILVYCRSGRRSKEAAKKLADMGYSNVYEFGGIIDWTGDIMKENETPDTGYEDMTPSAFLTVSVGDRFFSVDMENNTSANAFFEKIKENSISVEMHDYGDFEKVGDLPWDLPQNDVEITTQPGDLILYQGNKITIYYAENTWTFTRLGRLNATEEEIMEAFGGKDDIIAEFNLEWTE